AVIAGTTAGTVTEAGGVNNATAGTPTATGTLTDTDVDKIGRASCRERVDISGADGYGNKKMTSGGERTDTLNNSNATVQALNVGQSLTDFFSEPKAAYDV